MADNKVQIIVEAIDRTKGTLGKISVYFGDLQSSFSEISNSPFIKFLEDAIKYTEDYGTKVESFSRFTGMSLEETSKLIGAAQNFGVEYDTLMKGMENAIKGGREVTIEELGKIADEYVEIGKTDGPVGQAKLLVDNFGQAGLGLGALFEQGKEGVLGAMGEIDTALAWTEGDKNKLDAYKEATGEFNESLGGLKITVGTELLPLLSDFFGELNKIIGKFQEFDIKWRIFYANATTMGGLSLWSANRKEAFVLPEIKFAESLGDYQQYRDYMDEILGIADLIVDGYGAIRTKTGEVIEGTRIMTEEEWKANEAAKALRDNIAGIPNQKNILISVDAHFSTAAREAIGITSGGKLVDLSGKGTGKTVKAEAYGGPVEGRTPYIIGEKGPELFVPQTSGRIIPNNQLQQGGGGGISRADMLYLGKIIAGEIQKALG